MVWVCRDLLGEDGMSHMGARLSYHSMISVEAFL